MTTDRERAAAHAQAYHEAIYEVSADGFAPDYRVWSWEEMPPENKDLLVQASLSFLSTRYASAEQMAIALMAEARKLFSIAEKRSTSVGHDVDAYRLAERLAHWATEARQLGVRYFGDVNIEQQSRDMALKNMAEAQRKLSEIREIAKRWNHTAVYGQLLEVLDSERTDAQWG